MVGTPAITPTLFAWRGIVPPGFSGPTSRPASLTDKDEVDYETLAKNSKDIAAALELNQVAERHVGPIVDARHRFGNAAELQTLLTDNGFHDCRVETFSHDVRFSDGMLFARLNAMAVIAVSS
jgi:hypothetical protein